MPQFVVIFSIIELFPAHLLLISVRSPKSRFSDCATLYCRATAVILYACRRCPVNTP